jgi:REP element-mobilizing transposase RayT
MARGNDGRAIFVTDPTRKMFLATLGEACEQNGWWVHAYVLMSNHYHLLLETPEANLSLGMRWFQGAYTQRFNAIHHRRGHLFQGRYKAIPVQTDPREGGLEYFMELSTYIHLNPFRAGICGEGMTHPLESHLWSSYPAYIGKQRKRPEWLVRSKVFGSWGLKEGVNGTLKTYQTELERRMRFEQDPDAGRRGEFEVQVKRGWYLGSREFREKLSGQLDQADKGDNYRGAQRRAHNEDAAEAFLRQGLDVMGLKESDLSSLARNDPRIQGLAWLIKTHTSVTGVWLSQRLSMGHLSNISRALARFRSGEEDNVKKLIRDLKQCKGCPL